MPERPTCAFVVAVVGDGSVMRADQARRLIELLVTRHRDHRRIVLLCTGGDLDTGWCGELGWSVRLEPKCGSEVKQDCAIVAQADAVLVLGDPAPWARLLELCRSANIPTRVYRTCPKLPSVTLEWP